MHGCKVSRNSRDGVAGYAPSSRSLKPSRRILKTGHAVKSCFDKFGSCRDEGLFTRPGRDRTKGSRGGQAPITASPLKRSAREPPSLIKSAI